MRNFLVFYKGKYPSKSQDMSLYIFEDFLVTAEIYPNKETTLQQIRDSYGLMDVHITNIIEVTKEQMEHYYKGHER